MSYLPYTDLQPEASMERAAAQSNGGQLCSLHTASGRSPRDFAPRVVPYHPSASVQTEASQILWQK